MTYTVIWIVAWLLNGTPVSFSAVLPGNECTIDAAATIYRAKVDEAKAGTYQLGFSWWCDAIEARKPGGV